MILEREQQKPESIPEWLVWKTLAMFHPQNSELNYSAILDFVSSNKPKTKGCL